MRIRALVIRICRQFLRDPRTLALLFIAPLVILTLMKLVFNGQPFVPDVGVVGLPNAVSTEMAQQGFRIAEYPSFDHAQKDLATGELDAVIYDDGDGRPAVLLEGSDPAAGKTVLLLLQQTMTELAAPANADTAPQTAVTYLHGRADMTSFDNFGPVLIGLFSFFFVFMLAGVSFLRERTGGTLERLLATPIRRGEIVAGYLLGFGVFTLLQASLIAWYAVEALDMYIVGSMLYVLLVNLLLSLTALTLGTLLSTYANNEFQIIQFVPLVVVPQVFFSGLFPLETMAGWLQSLSKLMPLYYGAEALRGVMLRGESWADIHVEIGVLTGFSLAFAALNVLALRRHRAI